MGASINVVGGVENPRFLLLGPELSPNVGFEEDLTGVVGGAGTRVQDNAAPFGDYVLKIEDDNPDSSESVQITVETGADVKQRKFIALWYARNDADEGDQMMHVTVPNFSNTPDLNKDETLDPAWRQFVHEIVVPADATGQNVVYVVSPTARVEGVAGEGAIRLDNFRFREIFDEYELPLAPRGEASEGFREVFQAQNELLNGALRTYVTGYRYFYQAFYQRLTAAQETLRRRTLSRARDVLFFPHMDAQMSYFVRWDDEFESEWSDGMAELGHAGNVALIGTELIPALPADVVDPLTAYNPLTEDLILENGDVFIE